MRGSDGRGDDAVVGGLKSLRWWREGGFVEGEEEGGEGGRNRMESREKVKLVVEGLALQSFFAGAGVGNPAGTICMWQRRQWYIKSVENPGVPTAGSTPMARGFSVGCLHGLFIPKQKKQTIIECRYG